MRNNNIISIFCDCFNDFAALQNAISYEIRSEFKKNKEPLGLKSLIGKIYFNQFIVDFVYTVSFGSIGPKSVLECRIWLSKHEQLIFIPLYDILEFIDPMNFKCYSFPYIENGERMESCFSAIAEDLKALLPKIAELCNNSETVEQAIASRKHDFEQFYKENLFETPEREYDISQVENLKFKLEFYEKWVNLRFASKAYLAYLDANYDLAIKKYSKYKTRTRYEARLLDFMKTIPAETIYPAISQENNSLRGGLKAQTGSKELLPLFLSWIVLTPVTMLVYLLVYYIFLFIGNFGSIYFTGNELYHVVCVFLPSFLTAILLSFYLRKKFISLFFRTKGRKILEYDAILSTKSEIKFMNAFSYIVIVASVIFTVLLTNVGVRFYKDRIVVNPSLFSLKGTQYSYHEIDSVWEISGRYNDFGAWLNRPSYVILINDREEIDLYKYLEYEDSKEKVLPIFIEKGFTIKTAKDIDEVK